MSEKVKIISQDQNRYIEVGSDAFQEVMRKHLEDPDYLNIKSEIALLRTFLAEFLDDYESLRHQLERWYLSQGEKPRNLPDIRDAWELTQKIANVATNYSKMLNSNSISRQIFLKVVVELGRVVERHVDSTEVVDAIKNDWLEIINNEQ